MKQWLLNADGTITRLGPDGERLDIVGEPCEKVHPETAEYACGTTYPDAGGYAEGWTMCWHQARLIVGDDPGVVTPPSEPPAAVGSAYTQLAELSRLADE